MSESNQTTTAMVEPLFEDLPKESEGAQALREARLLMPRGDSLGVERALLRAIACFQQDSQEKALLGARFLLTQMEALLGRGEKEVSLLEETLEQAQTLQEVGLEGRLLWRLGELEAEKEQWDNAQTRLEKAVQCQQEIADQEGLSLSYDSLSQLAYKQEKAREAAKWLQKKIAVDKERGAIVEQAQGTALLGQFMATQGELGRGCEMVREAVILLEENKASRREIKEMKELLQTLERYHAAHLSQQRLPAELQAAYEKFQEADRRMQESKNPSELLLVHEMLEEVLQVNRRHQVQEAEAACLSRLGQIALALENPQQASEYLQESLRLLHELGMSEDAALVEHLLMQAAAPPASDESFVSDEDLECEGGDESRPERQASRLFQQGQILARSGEPADGVKMVREGYEILKKIDDPEARGAWELLVGLSREVEEKIVPQQKEVQPGTAEHAWLLYQIGILRLVRDEREAALSPLEEALDSNRKLPRFDGIIACLLALIHLYEEEGSPDKAAPLQKELQEIEDKLVAARNAAQKNAQDK